MKKSVLRILPWAAVLISLSCSAIGGASAPFPEPAPLSKPTPLSADSQAFDEAVAAHDDLSIVRFIANELRLAELETPYSPFELCFEETTQTVRTGDKGAFTAQWMDECGSPEDGDYAVASTVILTSAAKTAVCGYAFRSDDKGSRYELRLERANGSSRWSLVRLADGVVAEVLQEPVADERLDLSNGAQTRVLLYARGAVIKVYFNGHFVKMEEDSGLSAGKIGLFAESESGPAVCQYDSYWVNVYH
jgi:hypothetical protein